jgi:hypothetical protein
MFNITITEALAEVKTIGKRVETKQSQLRSFLFRDSRMKDPMEKDGGSVEFIKRERQSIEDLQRRIVALRLAIQQANMVTQLKVGETEMTVYEWLIWRREVAPHLQMQLSSMWNDLQQARLSAQRGGISVVAAAAAVSGNSDAKEVIVNVNEQELAKQREEVEKQLGELDGRLSLINATTMI